MDSNVKNIYIRSITSTSGDVEFYLYNNTDCQGSHIINGVLDKVSEDGYEKFIEPTVNINTNFSIKVVDSAGCTACFNKTLPEVTPIVTMVPPPSPSFIIPVPTPTPSPSPEPEIIYGDCYIIEIPIESLQEGGELLYIEKVDANTGTIINQEYGQYYGISEDINYYVLGACSTLYPFFSYGQFGPKIDPASKQIIISTGGQCQSDNECTL